MVLPVDTNKDDVDALVKYLKTKPLGVTVDAAKAAIGATLVHESKVRAYRLWDIIADSGGKLVLSTRGHKYAQASDGEKVGIYQQILRDEALYVATLESLHHQNKDQIELTDLISHWVRHHKNELGSDSEDYIKRQVTCFMGLADAAGLGNYILGRKGNSTRFEIDKSALEKFFTEVTEPESVAASNGSKTATAEAPAPVSVAPQQPAYVPPMPQSWAQQPPQVMSAGPALHIDVNIHIDADATPEAIEAIFASMSKHLYRNGDGQA